MKTSLLVLTATTVALAPAMAAPDLAEIHQRAFDHLKAVRNVLVPAPVIDFVEGFPPVAIPRQKVLQLAQVDDPAPPPPPVVDPAAIAEWATDFAAITTQRTLDGIFPRSTPKRPVIVGGDQDAKSNAALEEDLTVMMRVLEKAVGGKDEEKPRAMGIDVFSFGRSGGSPRAFYIDGYGPMFVLNVRYPLLAPPKKDDQVATNETTSSEWEKARQEVYGRRGGMDEFRANAAPGEQFDSERVESLKEQLIDSLANATHIKGLKPDDQITLVVLGTPSSTRVVRREMRAPRGGARASAGGGGGNVARVEAEVHSLEMNAASEAAAGQSTMTLRAKKSDIDSFAKGKLESDDFRKKVSVQVR